MSILFYLWPVNSLWQSFDRNNMVVISFLLQIFKMFKLYVFNSDWTWNYHLTLQVSINLLSTVFLGAIKPKPKDRLKTITTCISSLLQFPVKTQQRLVSGTVCHSQSLIVTSRSVATFKVVFSINNVPIK